MKRLNLIIQGQVQGVAFRYYIRQHAEQLNITGYARNLDREKVEVVAEGKEEDLQRLLELCHKGPSLAQVKKLSINYEPSKDEFTEFEIRF